MNAMLRDHSPRAQEIKDHDCEIHRHLFFDESASSSMVNSLIAGWTGEGSEGWTSAIEWQVLDEGEWIFEALEKYESLPTIVLIPTQ